MADIDRLVKSLAAQVTPVKPAPHPLSLGLKWAGAAVAYLVVALLLAGPRPDLMQELQNSWFVAELLTLLLIFVATTYSTALLAFPDLHQKRFAAFAPAWSFVLFIVVLLLALRADMPPAPLPVHSVECTVSISLLSVLPAAGLFYAIRKFASTHPHLAGSTAVLAAFSVSAIWLRLHEVNDSVIHVIEWHYLPMLAMALIGLLLGRALLRW